MPSKFNEAGTRLIVRDGCVFSSQSPVNYANDQLVMHHALKRASVGFAECEGSEFRATRGMGNASSGNSQGKIKARTVDEVPKDTAGWK